jgi:hypothetical protein
MPHDSIGFLYYTNQLRELEDTMTALTCAQTESFFAAIEASGLDTSTVREHGTQSKQVSVASMAELRELLGPQDAECRMRSCLNTPCPAEDDETSQAIRFMYGDGSLTASEISNLEQRYFPVEVTVTAEQDKTIPAGETWIIARDQPPQVLHFGTLTMEPGSKIEVYGTLVTMTCQRLVRVS